MVSVGVSLFHRPLTRSVHIPIYLCIKTMRTVLCGLVGTPCFKLKAENCMSLLTKLSWNSIAGKQNNLITYSLCYEF